MLAFAQFIKRIEDSLSASVPNKIHLVDDLSEFRNHVVGGGDALNLEELERRFAAFLAAQQERPPRPPPPPPQQAQRRPQQGPRRQQAVSDGFHGCGLAAIDNANGYHYPPVRDTFTQSITGNEVTKIDSVTVDGGISIRRHHDRFLSGFRQKQR